MWLARAVVPRIWATKENRCFEACALVGMADRGRDVCTARTTSYEPAIQP